MENKSFNEKCYELLKKIPKGKVTTYKEIALTLGSKGYRAVGSAMRRNIHSPKVPCHRVICSDGRIGGYALGIDKKIDLLKKEGVKANDMKVDLEKYFYRFS